MARTPPAANSPIYIRPIGPGEKAPSHALRVFGDGEVSIEGKVKLRFSGEGTLWVDKASTLIIDPATTGSMVMEQDFRRFDHFAGNLGIEGNPVLRMRAKGVHLRIIGNGKGKVTMTGKSGIFRLTQAGSKEVSGIWTEAGLTQQFEQVAVQAPAARTLLGPVGIIPATPPTNTKKIQRPLLPSENDRVATGALAPPKPLPPRPPRPLRPRRAVVPTPTPAPAPTPAKTPAGGGTAPKK